MKSYTGQSMKGSLKIEKCAQNSCLVLVTLWVKEEEGLCRVRNEAMQKTQHSYRETKNLVLARIWSKREPRECRPRGISRTVLFHAVATHYM